MRFGSDSAWMAGPADLESIFDKKCEEGCDGSGGKALRKSRTWISSEEVKQ